MYTLSIVGVIYTSLTAIRQTDLKRIIAYTSVAHMNLVVMGLFVLILLVWKVLLYKVLAMDLCLVHFF